MDKVTDTKRVAIQDDVLKSIVATPRMNLSKHSTRPDMGRYHRDLQRTISSRKYLKVDVGVLDELPIVKQKRSKHRPYVKQLSELLLTTVKLGFMHFHMKFEYENGSSTITTKTTNPTTYRLSKKETNAFFRHCLVGLTGDTDVLKEYSRIKRSLLVEEKLAA